MLMYHCLYYRKRGKIHWAKLSRFSQFLGVPWKFFREYKCLSLINEYLCTAYGQGNTKIFPQKLWWCWNREYLAQRIFPRLRHAKTKTNIHIQSFGMIYQNHTNIIMCTFGRITKTKIKLNFIPKNNTRICVYVVMLSSSVLYNAHHVQSLSNVTHNEGWWLLL